MSKFTITIHSAWLESPSASWRVFAGNVVISSEPLLSKNAKVGAVSQADSPGHNGESLCMTLKSPANHYWLNYFESRLVLES